MLWPFSWVHIICGCVGLFSRILRALFLFRLFFDKILLPSGRVFCLHLRIYRAVQLIFLWNSFFFGIKFLRSLGGWYVLFGGYWFFAGREWSHDSKFWPPISPPFSRTQFVEQVWSLSYRVATISRLLKMIGLFCKRAS